MLIPVQVTCYSAHRYDQRPQRIIMGNAVYEITDLFSVRLVDDGAHRQRVFRVGIPDGRVMILVYDVVREEWFLQREGEEQ